MSTRLLLPALFALAFATRVAAQAESPATPAPAPAAPAPAPAAQAPVPPTAQVEGAEPHKGGVTRDKDTLSVDFPDEEIKTILRNVADLFELNLVVPDTLTGKTSIKLRDVTWRQIFQVVLAPVGYTYAEEGNIIKIVSNESLTQEPTATDVFILNYAKASDIMPTLLALVDAAGGGKIVIDSRSNALVITERPSRMNRIRPIIEALDKATDQVMIESKFVEVTDSDVKNIGINWSSLANYRISAGNLGGTVSRSRGQTESDGNNLNRQNTTGTTADNTTTAQNDQTNTSTNTTTPTNTSTVTSANGTVTTNSSTGNSTSLSNIAGTTSSLTNATGTGATSAITDAFNLLQSLTNTAATNRTLNAVFSANDFSLVLSALQTLQKSKIVSNPTVVTLNNTEAVINVGQERPIPSYTYNQQTGTYEVSGFTYKPIGVILKVTPQVNNRGFIKLTVEPEVSQSTRDAVFGGASIPIIETRKAKTQVSLKDGFTMGIGGLMQSTATNSSNKIPLLGSIPGLGRLFRSDNKNIESSNLIIFITARTINAEGASVEQVFDSERVRQLNMRREDLPGYRDGSDPFLPAAGPPAAKPGEPPPAPEKKPFFRSSSPAKDSGK